MDNLLEESLGLSVLPRRTKPNRLPRVDLPLAPIRAALTMAGIYLVVFVALPWARNLLGDRPIGAPLKIMLVFQVYGTFWSARATATIPLCVATRVSGQSQTNGKPAQIDLGEFRSACLAFLVTAKKMSSKM